MANSDLSAPFRKVAEERHAGELETLAIKPIAKVFARANPV